MGITVTEKERKGGEMIKSRDDSTTTEDISTTQSHIGFTGQGRAGQSRAGVTGAKRRAPTTMRSITIMGELS